MNLSEFAFKLIFLFIPGLIAFNIVDKLTFHKEFKTPNILLGSLTYGFICYLIYYFLFIFLADIFPFFPKQTFYFAENLTNSEAKLNFQEIMIVTLFAIPTGLFSAAFVNSRVLFKLSSKLNISDKLDDIGVWNKALEDSLNNWIVIRDVKNDIMYRGWIESFSDGLDNHEILLRQAEVFRNSDANILYSIPSLYINLNKENNLTIEFQTGNFAEDMYNNFIERPSITEEENSQYE
jgi:hypothetical protein